MSVATRVKVLNGRPYVLEFNTGDNYVTAWIKLDRQPIGYAKLLLRDNIAELADIQIFDSAPNCWPLLRLLSLKFCRRNFRGKGIGSFFLNAVCDHLRFSGIKRIEGTMSGDLQGLARWYRKAGFAVNQISGAISKNLC